MSEMVQEEPIDMYDTGDMQAGIALEVFTVSYQKPWEAQSWLVRQKELEKKVLKLQRRVQKLQEEVEILEILL